jgi:hypothetical protein
MCGVILPPQKEGVIVEEQFLMRLSPQGAQALANTLSSYVKGWEDLFGKLPEPRAALSGDKAVAASLLDMKEKLAKLEGDS